MAYTLRNTTNKMSRRLCLKTQTNRTIEIPVRNPFATLTLTFTQA